MHVTCLNNLVIWTKVWRNLFNNLYDAHLWLQSLCSLVELVGNPCNAHESLTKYIFIYKYEI